jgi:hypothetical protein
MFLLVQLVVDKRSPHLLVACYPMNAKDLGKFNCIIPLESAKKRSLHTHTGKKNTVVTFSPPKEPASPVLKAAPLLPFLL